MCVRDARDAHREHRLVEGQRKQEEGGESTLLLGHLCYESEGKVKNPYLLVVVSDVEPWSQRSSWHFVMHTLNRHFEQTKANLFRTNLFDFDHVYLRAKAISYTRRL